MQAAPTDVSAPPDGWSWAKREPFSKHIPTGVFTYLVWQHVPKSGRYKLGYRQSGPLELEEANKQMIDWNNEAKSHAD